MVGNMELTLMEEFTIPENLLHKGANIVWVDGEYVYKAYQRASQEEVYRSLATLNTVPEYEYEEVVGVVKDTNWLVTRQRKLKDWQEILATYIFTEGKRYDDWRNIIKQFMLDQGFTRDDKRQYTREGITLSDICFKNFGMDDQGNLKIIDASVYDIR